MIGVTSDVAPHRLATLAHAELENPAYFSARLRLGALPRPEQALKKTFGELRIGIDCLGRFGWIWAVMGTQPNAEP